MKKFLFRVERKFSVPFMFYSMLNGRKHAICFAKILIENFDDAISVEIWSSDLQIIARLDHHE